MQEIRHHLGVLDIGAARYGLIIREGLSDTLDDKALVDKHVQPLTEGVGVTRHMEFGSPCTTSAAPR